MIQVTKAETITQLEKQVEKLQTEVKYWKKLAQVDSLTNLANRRVLDEALDAEWRRCSRNEKPISFLLIDVDHFKHYNDTYGHTAGDHLLVFLGTALAQLDLRTADVRARYGGEEFAILLPECPIDRALEIAEKAAALIQEHCSSKRKTTVSIGVACVQPRRNQPFKRLIDAADAALYRAKEQGRNRVVVQG